MFERPIKETFTVVPQHYIISPRVDWGFIILAPLIWVVLAAILEPFRAESHEFEVLTDGLVGVVILGHLFISFFRTHLNKKIYRLYPTRFVVLPLVVLLILSEIHISVYTLLFAAIILIFMDIWHSSLQTFGFGRIYDLKQKNFSFSERARNLDKYICLYSLIAPFMISSTMVDFIHENNDSTYSSIESVADKVRIFGNFMFDYQFERSGVFIIIGIVFVSYYLYAYWQLHKEGYQVPIPKVALFSITAICNFIAWNCFPLGEAYLISEGFHAYQYFAIVWYYERDNITSIFKLKNFKRTGVIFAFVLFLGIAASYGV